MSEKIKQQVKAHFKIILMDKILVLSTGLIMKIGHVSGVSPLYQAVSLETLEMTSFCDLYITVDKKFSHIIILLGISREFILPFKSPLILKDRYN